MPHAKISVIMSIYNENMHWIEESIDSILNQTYRNFEFIIVNDNPERFENDLILESYKKKDSRIVILKNEKNFGLTKSLNKALRVAKGKYIARMDADDISLPNRIERQVRFLEKNKEIDLCGTWAKIFGNGNGKTKSPINAEVLSSKLFFRNCITHASVMFRKSSLEKCHIFYDEPIKKAQDYDLWTTFVFNGLKMVNIPDYLLFYREHENQISNKSFEQQQQFVRIIKKRWLKQFNIFFEESEFSTFLKFCNYKQIELGEGEILTSVITKIKRSNYHTVIKKRAFLIEVNKRIGFYTLLSKNLTVKEKISMLNLILIS